MSLNATIYAVCIVAVALHVIGIPALIWSIRNKQGLESDQEVYRSMQPYRQAAPVQSNRINGSVVSYGRYTPAHIKIFFGFIIIMLLMMCAAQVYLAVVATHVPSTQAAFKRIYHGSVSRG